MFYVFYVYMYFMEIDLFFDVILLLKDKVNNICLLFFYY